MSFPFLQPYAGLSNSLQTAQAGGAGGIGGWVELGRTTLGSAGDNIDVTSLANKRYYMVLGDFRSSGNTIPSVRFNSDTGANYARRQSNNGGADATVGSATLISWGSTDSAANQKFGFGYLANLSSKEKLWMAQMGESNTAGAANATDRREVVAKWANTSNSISSINVVNQSSGDYVSGSEVVVLGWDPADTHTTNFWEELDSTSFSGSASEFTSGTFSAKKYIWCQYYVEGTASLRPFSVRFNGDTAGNYAIRRSAIGAADSTFGSTTSIDGQGGSNVTNYFVNMFIINNSSNEKLVIAHSNSVVTQGAGTAPRRDEIVGKWANTSSQITSITARSADSGNITTGEMKVWGSD
jgi:hypothetical protein